MKHIYYYVPPCPRCNSKKTGRYLRRSLSGTGYSREASLRHGELVRFASDVPYDNCFCESCGNEWHQYIPMSFFTKDEIMEEKRARGTEPLYQQLLDQKAAQADGRGFFGKLFGKKQATASSMPPQRYPDRVEESPFDIIDSRPKDTLEILYTDDDLIEKLMEVRYSEQC